MDKFLGRTLGVATLLAGIGVFYHFVIYVPGLERERQAEKAQEAARIADQKFQRASRYQVCMIGARENYDQNWAAACKSFAADQTRNLKNCYDTPSIMTNQFMGRQWCEKQYGDIDSSNDCTLPGGRAELVNQYFADAKAQCEKDVQIGTL